MTYEKARRYVFYIGISLLFRNGTRHIRDRDYNVWHIRYLFTNYLVSFY